MTEVVEDERRQRRAARDAGQHVAAVAHREDRSTGCLDLELGDRVGRHRVSPLDQLAGELGDLTRARGVDACRVDQAAGGIEDDGRQDVRGAVDESRGDHRGHNSRVPLPRISWMVTVGLCVIAAVLLLVSGYSGYAAILVAIGLAAAVNLL